MPVDEDFFILEVYPIHFMRCALCNES